jgi:biotin synthase
MALPATTALLVVEPEARNSVFDEGADVIMKTVTPIRYRQYYAVYPSPGVGALDIAADRRELEETIRSLGRVPV